MRELEDVIERAVALETTPSVQIERLPTALGAGVQAGETTALGGGFSVDDHGRSIEASLVRRAFRESGGSRSGAALLLGATPRSVRYLIRKHRLAAGSDKP